MEYCRPSLRAILKGARQVHFSADFLELMEKMDEQLAHAETTCQHFLTQEIQQNILLAYVRLEEKMPKIFRRDNSNPLRERIIFESILFQVEGIGKKTLQRLSAAGLTSLRTFSLLNVFDLSSVTGISLLRCRRICLTFREHFAWIESIPPEKHHQLLLDRLRNLTSQLSIWRRKKRMRKNDETVPSLTPETSLLHTLQRKKMTLLQIRLILAELNQLELLRHLEAKRISQVICQLNDFLAVSSISAGQKMASS